jgi:hypothetical protein
MGPEPTKRDPMHPRLERDIAACKTMAACKTVGVRLLRDCDVKSRNAFRLADRVYDSGIPAARFSIPPGVGIETAAPD